MNIKTKFFAIFLVLIWLAAANMRAQEVTTNYYFQTANAPIPDENPNGYNTAIQVSNIVGTIQGLSVFINVTNGFNGDLYAYLVNPGGLQAILLNRVGVDSSDPFGYSDEGFDIAFNIFATNDIHYYQTLSYTLNGGNQLTGVWAADGRDVDPQSVPAVFDSAPQTETLSQFLDTDPNGEWTLFFSDLNGEYQSTLIQWELQLETVPEPGTSVLFALAGGLSLVILRRKLWRTAR